MSCSDALTVIGIFPNQDSVIRLGGMTLQVQADGVSLYGATLTDDGETKWNYHSYLAVFLEL